MNIPNEDQRIFLENIIDTIRESLIVLDEQMRILTVNRSFLTQFQVLPEETEGRLIYELGNGQWDIPMLHDLLENIIAHQTNLENFEVRHRFQTIGEKVMQLNARRLVRASGKSAMILLAIKDITERYTITEKLEESEALYRKFTEEANSLVIGLDKNGIIRFFNRFCEKVFGYQRNEVIGKPFLGTIIPSIDSRGNDYTAIITEILSRPEKFYAQECEGIRKDGSKAWFSFSVKGIRELKGNVSEIIIDGNDITELQEARLQLKEKSASLDTLFNYIPEGVIVCDAENSIRYVSRSIEGMFKIPAESLLNTCWDECLQKIKIYHANGLQITSHEELPTYKVVTCGKPCSEYDLILKRNGTIKTVSIDAAPTFDTHNKISGTVEVWHDITDRKKVEKAMRESEERFRTLSDNISQLAWMADTDGSISWFNKRWYEFTGTTYDEIMLKGLSTVVHPDYYGEVMSGYNESVKKGTPWTATFPMRKYDGSFRWFLSHAMPIYGNDHTIIRWFGTNTDVTELRTAQQQLRDAAVRFQRMMSSNIIGLVIADFDGSILSGNSYYYNLTGYSEEEFTKKLVTWKSITPPEYLPLDYHAIEEMRQSGSCSPYEKQYIRKDGTRVWVLIAFTSLPGTPNQCISFILDITVRKKALDEAQRRRAENEAILNSIPDGYVIIDAQGSILKMNDRARSALGVFVDDNSLPYYDWVSRLHLSDSEGRQFRIEELPSYRALHGETVRDVIVKIPHAEEDLWVSASASPITIDNKRYGVILEISDITELHKLQEQIAEEKNFVNAILETSGGLITVLDNNLKIIRFNKACEELTGFTADEVKNRSMLDLFVPDEEHEALLKFARRFTRDESVLEHENHWKTKSGEMHFIRWRKTAWFDSDGNVKIIIATGIDITDRMQLEQQLRTYKSRLEHRAEELAEANRDLESFSYSVSHDLRSPLSAVKGFTNILEEDYGDKLDEDGRDCLQSIKTGIDKMADLINDILNLSRIGRQEVKRETVDLSSMVRKYLDELASLEPRRVTEFVIEENVTVQADPRLVHVELENLLRNAWKFTLKKEVTHIEFGSMHPDGKTVFYLRDNGIGFDQKVAKRIFEPFKRAHSEKEYGGTGIGLSIVQRVIKKHNGEVWAEGIPGVGATFYFTLGG